MKLKVFTLKWDDAAGRFSDAEMRSFLHEEGTEREVIDVSEHFFVHEKSPVWAVMVTYRENGDMHRPRYDREPRKDWRADLGEREKSLYDEMRKWRSRAAKRDGLPPYLILTNRQIAEMAARRPATGSGMREIEGFGEAKSARWGEEILALIAASENATRREDGDADGRDNPSDPPALGKDAT